MDLLATRDIRSQGYTPSRVSERKTVNDLQSLSTTPLFRPEFRCQKSLQLVKVLSNVLGRELDSLLANFPSIFSILADLLPATV